MSYTDKIRQLIEIQMQTLAFENEKQENKYGSMKNLAATINKRERSFDNQEQDQKETHKKKHKSHHKKKKKKSHKRSRSSSRDIR
jgi:hypothetical protein